MSRMLKRWESPRREGRNDKGRGGSARARQVRKQQQMLKNKLKNTPEPNLEIDKKQKGEENLNSSLFFL
jgi:hypothetical protein